MATTFAAIRDRMKTVIEAATPDAAPIQDLFRYRIAKSRRVEDWAKDSSPGSCFRVFDIRRVGDIDDSQATFGMGDEVFREAQVQITICYPYLPDLYGSSYEAMEDCLQSDADQIRELMLSPSTASGIAGGAWRAAKACIVHEPERDEKVWLQRLTVTVLYCQAQTLT